MSVLSPGILLIPPMPYPWTSSHRMPPRPLRLSMLNLELIIYSPVSQATHPQVTSDFSLSFSLISDPIGSVSTACQVHLVHLFCAPSSTLVVPLPDFGLWPFQSSVSALSSNPLPPDGITYTCSHSQISVIFHKQKTLSSHRNLTSGFSKMHISHDTY